MGIRLTHLYEEFVNTRGALRSLSLAFCYKNSIKIKTPETTLEKEGLATLLEGDERELFLSLTSHPQIPVMTGLPEELIVSKTPHGKDISPAVELCASNYQVARRALEKCRESEQRFRENFPDFYEENKELFRI
jgi:hypothetical protein